MAQDDPPRGSERPGLARELIEAWAQRDLVEPPMTPERLAHTRRKRGLQVLALVWLLANGIVVLIWAMEPGEKSLARFWPAWIAALTALPLALVGLYVFGRRPIKEPPTRFGTRRAVSTVLFTDIVVSTERAQGLGDRRWRDLLDRHDAAAGTVVRRHGGKLIKTTGDGVLATFDVPGDAIRAARDLREEVRAMEIDIARVCTRARWRDVAPTLVGSACTSPPG
jgi:hypothetical protein